jgi:hypothetical protein
VCAPYFFRRRATVHFLEIGEGNLISPLGVRGMLVIDTEMPFRERFDSVRANEFVSCPYLDVSFTDDKGHPVAVSDSDMDNVVAPDDPEPGPNVTS